MTRVRKRLILAIHLSSGAKNFPKVLSRLPLTSSCLEWLHMPLAVNGRQREQTTMICLDSEQSGFRLWGLRGSQLLLNLPPPDNLIKAEVCWVSNNQYSTPHARDTSRASSSTGRKEEREGSWPRVNRKPVLRLRGPSVAPVQRPGTVLASLAGLFSVEPH